MQDNTKCYAEGTFVRIGPHVFRTQAWIQWGHSHENAGLIVMLNPGSSRLDDTEQWARLKHEERCSVVGKLWMDETMQEVVDIVNQAFPQFQGRLEIRNLFNLREPDMDVALNAYRNLVNCPDVQSVLHSKFEDTCTFPWVWLAWGYKSKKILNERKKEVYSRIHDVKGLHIFEVGHPKLPRHHVGHPRPRRIDQRKTYRERILSTMRSCR